MASEADDLAALLAAVAVAVERAYIFPVFEYEVFRSPRKLRTISRMGVLLSIVASAVVAARLLFVYKRLRQPPELFLGLAYLVAGTLGWGGLLMGALLTPKDQTLSEGYQAWSVVFGDTGTFFFYLFVWYVFRRPNLFAKVVVGVVALVFAVSIGRDTILHGVTFGPPPGAATTLAGMTARAVVFAWMAFEAFAAYAAFRRRARVGLGNPVVASRLLLWGISAVAMLIISTTSAGLYATATDTVEATHRQNQAGALYGLLGALSSVALWLAFFPPRAYQAWIEKSQKEGPSRG